MSKIFELNEYANLPDNDDTFSERRVIIFTSPETCLKFIKEDDFYGMCYVYDKDEYEDYNISQDASEDMPSTLYEFTADVNTSIEDF